MANTHLKLVSYSPGYFAGINQDNGPIFNGTDMVLVFPDDKNIIEFSGNQGTGKTSNVECLKMLLGNEEADNALNDTANDLRANLTIRDEMKNCVYVVKRTRGSFSIERQEGEGPKPQKSTVKEPKTFLRELIGNVGLDPMALRTLKGKQQIEWLRKICPMSTGAQEMEKQILAKHKDAFETRTDVNRDVKNLQREVTESGYYAWDDDNKVFHATPQKEADLNEVNATPLDEVSIRESFETASAQYNQYNRAKEKIESYNDKSETIQKEIEDLEARLAKKREELGEVEQAIEKGQEWLKENEDVPVKYEAAKSLLANAGELRTKKQNLAAADKKYVQYEEKLREQMLLNAKLDELTTLHKELIKESTPDIPGLEVVIGGLDTKEEGLYYKGRPMNALCESEVWEMYFQMPHMRIVFLENISSLGTGAVEQINKFAANGGRVFCTQMDRKQPNLKVTFLDKID